MRTFRAPSSGSLVWYRTPRRPPRWRFGCTATADSGGWIDGWRTGRRRLPSTGRRSPGGHPPRSTVGESLPERRGKLLRLPVNPRAMALVWVHNSAFRDHDVIVGDVLIVGPPD